MDSGIIYTQIQIAEDVLHDLAEGQSHDCQIVAPEPQHRDTDEEADDASQHTADDHAQHQAQRAAGHRLRQKGCGDDAGKRADTHKSGMAQAQFTADTHQQVQGHGQHNIGTGGNQEALGGAVQLSLGIENLKDHKRRSHQNIGRGVFHLILNQFLFHGTHLTPSPGPACPTGPRASPEG